MLYRVVHTANYLILTSVNSKLVNIEGLEVKLFFKIKYNEHQHSVNQARLNPKLHTPNKI